MACLPFLLIAQVRAEVQRLDDRGTYSIPPVPSLQWLSWHRAGARSVMVGLFELHLNLDVAAWVGRQGRIYLRLPRDQNASMELTWSAGQLLSGGRVSSGERTLIYSGEIRSPRIEEVLNVQIRSEPEWTGQSRRLDVAFELEGV